MTRLLPLLAAGLALALPARADDKKPEAKKADKPRVEVVFCLDTTGSMSGLIEGAKAKIWSISNQIANGKPTPDLKIGLVAYRDKGDAYVTQVHDLTDDLDAVHAKLREFKAEGGGDGPESVNQALDDAVNKVKWSTDKKTLRIIFLVGDCEPHMDYKDDVKYPDTCKKACEKAILINTIQCGVDIGCAKHWKEICLKAEGSYVQVKQDGGAVVVATPYDKELAALNTELAESTLVFGDRAAREEAEALRGYSYSLSTKAPAEAAERTAYFAKGGRAAAYDLLDQVKAGKVKLDDLKEDQLPRELKKLKKEERKAYLDKLDKRRGELRQQVLELDKKRADHIAKEMEKDKGKGKARSGFDTKVLEMIREQAKKHDIKY
jgi:Mg-chelatase subunit ChlD